MRLIDSDEALVLLGIAVSDYVSQRFDEWHGMAW
jgi:hypothetical protein